MRAVKLSALGDARAEKSSKNEAAFHKPLYFLLFGGREWKTNQRVTVEQAANNYSRYRTGEDGPWRSWGHGEGWDVRGQDSRRKGAQWLHLVPDQCLSSTRHLLTMCRVEAQRLNRKPLKCRVEFWAASELKSRACRGQNP